MFLNTVHLYQFHDAVVKWKHSPREFPAQRPVTRSFDVLFDLRLNNAWVNNREAGDLRRHRAHYGVIVIYHVVAMPSI